MWLYISLSVLAVCVLGLVLPLAYIRLQKRHDVADQGFVPETPAPLPVRQPFPTAGQAVAPLPEELERGLDALYSSEPPHPDEAITAIETIIVASEVMDFVRERIRGLDRYAESYKLFRTLNQPNLGVRQATEIVSKDLVFSSKIIKTANAPLFRAKTTVTSLHNALMLLGLNCVVSMYFRDHFKFVETRDKAMLDYSRKLSEHAVLTATCASFVARALGKLEKETAYTLGLLHDIGKFVMPEVYAKFCLRLGVQPSEIIQKKPSEEMEEVGIAHTLVGGMAGLQLGLPEPMDRVIALHHSLAAFEQGAPALTGIKPYILAVFVANQLAKCLPAPDAEGADEASRLRPRIDPLPFELRQYLPRAKLVELVSAAAFKTEIAKLKASAGVG